MPSYKEDVMIIGKNMFSYNLEHFDEEIANGKITKEEVEELLEGIHDEIEYFKSLKVLTVKYIILLIVFIIIFLNVFKYYAETEDVADKTWLNSP
jgi:hypothetical protein